MLLIISCHDYINHELIIFPIQMLAAIYIIIASYSEIIHFLLQFTMQLKLRTE